jgi:hypothetical protein
MIAIQDMGVATLASRLSARQKVDRLAAQDQRVRCEAIVAPRATMTSSSPASARRGRRAAARCGGHGRGA